jgi:microcystin-dependent protein
MADPFIGEIRIVGFDFNPRQWAPCDGRLLPISQNTALFSLLGTSYGGDGRTTFGLPNLQGRAPMHLGQGPGLSQHDLGESGGSSSVSLTQTQIPAHNHGVVMTAASGEDTTPNGQVLGQVQLYGPANNLAPMKADALPLAGGSQPHNNMMPYLVLNFVIALQGIYPARN